MNLHVQKCIPIRNKILLGHFLKNEFDKSILFLKYLCYNSNLLKQNKMISHIKEGIPLLVQLNLLFLFN